jgi:hypothetical protein
MYGRVLNPPLHPFNPILIDIKKGAFQVIGLEQGQQHGVVVRLAFHLDQLDAAAGVPGGKYPPGRIIFRARRLISL